jgi:5-formyltetrahydrofolate cyclo-ligase
MRMSIEKRFKALGLNLKAMPDEVESLTKKQIRSKILLRLKTQKEADQYRKSKIIKDKLFRALVFKKAKTIMFYISFDGEVDTQEMIKEAQKIGKTVTVPVCESNRTIRPCILQHKAKLKKGLYGICEPAIKRFIKAENLDLVVAPGVAFDKKGSRLGRGKGYYDNLLKKLSRKATSVGLAFDFQILPFVPATITDAAVHRIIFA